MIDILVFAFLASRPFYFFSSGGPQISDIFGLLIILYVLFLFLKTSVKLNKQEFRLFSLLFSFIFFTLIISTTWALIAQNYKYLNSSIMYFYNSLLMLSFYIYFAKLRRFSLVFVFYTLAIAGLFSLIIGFNPSGVRQYGMFNNPNQLAYYSLLVTCALFYLIEFSRVSIKVLLIPIAITGITCVMSFSAAAIFAYFVGGLYLLRRYFLDIKLIPACLVFLILIVIATTSLYNTSEVFSTSLDARIERKESSAQNDVSFWQERGYDRIINNSEYLLFGAAEAEYNRFDSYIVNDDYQLEIHSTFGTVIFGYGILGFILFSSFLLKLFRNNFVSIITFTPIFLYWLAHNGLRFPLLWVLLSLVAYLMFGEHRRYIKK